MQKRSANWENKICKLNYDLICLNKHLCGLYRFFCKKYDLSLFFHLHYFQKFGICMIFFLSFWKKSYACPGFIYVIKNTLKTAILWITVRMKYNCNNI